MTHDDLERFAEIMIVINEVFGDPRLPVSDIKMRFYFKALRDLTIDELSEAAINLANTKTIRTFPSPAEIRNVIHGRPEDAAQIAWGKFLFAVRAFGGHETVIFDDPVIHAIIAREGGWVEITKKTNDEMKWFGKDFLKIYAAYAPEIKNMAVPYKLVGIYEADNAGVFDNHVPPPVTIGDPQKAIGWQNQRRELKTETMGKVLEMITKKGGTV